MAADPGFFRFPLKHHQEEAKLKLGQKRCLRWVQRRNVGTCVDDTPRFKGHQPLAYRGVVLPELRCFASMVKRFDSSIHFSW